MNLPRGYESSLAAVGCLMAMVVLTTLAAPSSASAAPASETPPAPEDLFKWGEYDSLIRVLEPAIYNSQARTEFTRLDSVLHAKTFLYLGVAYYAIGKREHADDAFTHACDLDSAIKIDRFYVTEEIAGHFEGIAAVLASRRKQVRVTGASLPSGEFPASDANPKSSHGGRGEAAVASGNEHAWIWWTLGSALVLAGGGGAYYVLHKDQSPAENVTEVAIP